MVLKINVIECISKRLQCLFPFIRFKLALPNNNDVPSHFRKTFLLFFVTLTIAIDFLCPIIYI